MRFNNRLTSRISQVPKWSMTKDGFLRCTARVQQEKILHYTLDELEGHPDGFNVDPVRVYVPKDALADPESLKSLEGVPVVSWEHTWTDPSITKYVAVGSVAGTPELRDDFLVCDLLITDATTIEQIKNGDIGEISAAYHGDTIFEEGEWLGETFDAKQGALRYNHIAVIPAGQGRAGTDVRIINKLKKQEKRSMDNPKLVRVQARNSKKYMNMDEESAEVYGEEVTNADDKMEEITNVMDGMRGEIDTNKENMVDVNVLQAKIEELEGQLAVYKQQMEGAATQDQLIEEAAMNMIAETNKADTILKDMDLVTEDGNPMEKEAGAKFMNSIRSMHGDTLRKKVLSAVGINTKDMSSEALGGAWNARGQLVNIKRSVVAGKNIFTSHLQDGLPPGARSARNRLGIK